MNQEAKLEIVVAALKEHFLREAPGKFEINDAGFVWDPDSNIGLSLREMAADVLRALDGRQVVPLHASGSCDGAPST